MSWPGFLQLALLAIALVITVRPLGRYMAAVYGSREDGSAPGDRVFRPIERVIYRMIGVDDKREQRWSTYAFSLIAFSLLSLIVLYALQRTQSLLPFNPTNRE